jgi:hypothetical protein
VEEVALGLLEAALHELLGGLEGDLVERREDVLQLLPFHLRRDGRAPGAGVGAGRAEGGDHLFEGVSDGL